MKKSFQVILATVGMVVLLGAGYIAASPPSETSCCTVLKTTSSQTVGAPNQAAAENLLLLLLTNQASSQCTYCICPGSENLVITASWQTGAKYFVTGYLEFRCVLSLCQDYCY